MPASDATLVLGVRNGDRAAFAELYDRRARLIRAICYEETGEFETAADLTQEVFLRAFQKLNGLRDPQRFAAWLVGIARQVVREWRRSRQREQARLNRYAALQAAVSHFEPPPDAALEAAEADVSAWWRRAESPLAALGPRERLALHAYYAQGGNVDEARGVVGLSRSVFYRVLSGACRTLREVLRGQEVQP